MHRLNKLKTLSNENPTTKNLNRSFLVNVIFILAWYQFDYHIITIIYPELLNKISLSIGF